MKSLVGTRIDANRIDADADDLALFDQPEGRLAPDAGKAQAPAFLVGDIAGGIAIALAPAGMDQHGRARSDRPMGRFAALDIGDGERVIGILRRFRLDIDDGQRTDQAIDGNLVDRFRPIDEMRRCVEMRAGMFIKVNGSSEAAMLGMVLYRGEFRRVGAWPDDGRWAIGLGQIDHAHGNTPYNSSMMPVRI